MLKYAFRLKLLPTLAFIVVLAVLLSLARWQFGRAEEKEALLDLSEMNAQEKVADLSLLSEKHLDEIRYKQIALVGHYDSAHQFLLDNQIKSGKAGFMVLTPFIVDGIKKVILINRGWVPIQGSRSVVPDLTVTDGEIAVHGRINKFPSVGIRLKGAEIPTEGWPSLIQIVDENAVSKKLNQRIWPFQIELNADEANGYLRDWQFNREMQPEQHIAYAIQWLALAVTLTGLFIWFTLKGGHEKSTS